ncbi:MAG: DUF4065 domain-containing protein [Deltaproteobacteria bacterium]|nr:DUF4065 domain-containing protein [Deltaproteobacteria bacterium]
MKTLGPHALRTFRERTLELTQLQLAELVGMGVATINRYENGSEPTPAHRQLLEGLISDPNTLLRLLAGKETRIGAGNHARLLKLAAKRLANASLMRVEQLQYQPGTPKFSGKRQFDSQRLIEMVRYFTSDGEWKTKLNKLLFYADFIAFKELGRSISGTRYVIGNYGPIPDGHESIYGALIESKVVEPREHYARESGEPVEKLYASSPPDRRAFSLPEFKIMERIKSFFTGMSAKQIADYSHEESAYLSGELGSCISYSEATSLRDIPKPAEKRSSPAELAREVTRKIPTKEFKKLPQDASENLDHYLHGHPKRSK